MCAWKVEPDLEQRTLGLRLEGLVSIDEMREFCAAHDRGVDSFRGLPYRVFCDIRGLRPLSPEATELFEKAKAYSAKHKNFRGSAVLVDSQLLAMQHQRTSIASGVMITELITSDERACKEHLDKLRG